MQRYDSYKDSGIQWLGEIPSHWEMQRTKYIWRETDTRSENGSEQLLSVSQYDGVRESKSDSRSESLKGYKLVKQSELVINIMLAWLGGLGVSKYEGLVSPAYCVYKLISKQNPYFLHYLYRTPMYLSEFARRSSGIVPSRWRMYSDDFGEVLTLLPPLPEQQAIASYLDTVTAKIDEAIAQQQKMIDLLNERKQIIINNAVTKGLNPNAKMKPSGIDWIGEIPEASIICKLKQYVDVTDGTHDTPKYVDIMSNTYPLVTSRCIIDGNIDFNLANHISEYDYKEIAKRSYVSKFDVIMPMIGTVGNPALVTTEDKFAIKNVALFRTQGNYQKGKLLLALLNSNIVKHQMSLYNKGGVQNFVSQEIIKNLIVIIPNNIQEIIEYIDIKCSEIDKALKNSIKQIALLQERKQIIINDVVTGKVKVCNN